MSLLVEKVTGKAGMDLALNIRHTVFVIEQGVNPEDEYDQFEDEATHFLASLNGKAVGTARYRFTPYGIKLERFAVLKEARGRGVGQALVSAVLRDLMVNEKAIGKVRYYSHFRTHGRGTAGDFQQFRDWKQIRLFE